MLNLLSPSKITKDHLSTFYRVRETWILANHNAALQNVFIILYIYTLKYIYIYIYIYMIHRETHRRPSTEITDEGSILVTLSLLYVTVVHQLFDISIIIFYFNLQEDRTLRETQSNRHIKCVCVKRGL